MGNLASAVDELLAEDPRDVPSAALGEEIVEISRQLSRLQAAYLDRIEAFDRTGAALAEHGSTAAWLRAKTRATPNASQAQQIASLRSATMHCAPRSRISSTSPRGSRRRS